MTSAILHDRKQGLVNFARKCLATGDWLELAAVSQKIWTLEKEIKQAEMREKALKAANVVVLRKAE